MALNFNTICRLCMGKKATLLPLFKEKKGQVVSLPAKIMNCVPVLKVSSDDGLPAQVCRPCVRLVNTSYKFKKQCENSDTALRQILSTQSSQVITEEIMHSVFQSEINEDDWKLSAVKSEMTVEEMTPLDFLASNADSDDQRESDDVNYPEENEWTNPKAGPSSKRMKVANKKPKKSIPTTRKCIKGKRTGRKIVSSCNLTKNEVKNEEKTNLQFDRTLLAEDSEGKTESDVKVESCVNLEIKSSNKAKEKKSFLCHDCGKNFSRKQHLLLHLRTHTGEKPFACKECGESFGMSSNLNKHMRIHTGERPFLCTMCGKCFGRSDTLTKHMRCHTGEKPFHCNLCGNNFGRSSTLINHMRTHLGEKPYLCTECGRRFVQSYDLTKHMRSHTGEKPYCCPVCHMCFGQKNSLNKHMRSHSGEISVPSMEFQRTMPFVHYRPNVADLSMERSAVLVSGNEMQ